MSPPPAGATARPPGPAPAPPAAPGDGERRLARSLRYTGPGRIAGRGLQFALQLVLGRFLGPAGYGVFTLAHSVYEVLVQCGLLGLHNGAVRFGAAHLADGDAAAVRGCHAASRRTATVASVSLAALLWFAAPALAAALGEPALDAPLRVFAVALPFEASLFLSQFWARVFGRVDLDVLLADLARPALAIGLVAIVLAAGAGPAGAAVGWGAAGAIAAVAGVLLVRGALAALPPSPRAPYDARALLRVALPTLLVGFGFVLMGHLDKLILGAHAPSEEVGRYSAAFRLSRQIGLVQLAFVPAFAPLVSALHRRETGAELARLYATASRWILAASLPALLVTVIFGDLLLVLFGDGYRAARPLLAILAAGQFLSLAGGLANQVLQMSGRQDEDLAILAGSLAANVALNLWLVRTHGALGVAVATAVTFTAMSLLRLLAVRRYLGLWPYSRAFAAPLLAALAAGALGAGGRGLLPGAGGALLALTASLGLYAVLAWRHALEPGERAALGRLVRIGGGARR